MSEYTRFERRLARLLSSNPFIKAMLKKAYVVVMRLSAFGKSRISSDFKITPIFSLKESFFGYYDTNPSNTKGLVLFHSSDYDTSKPPEYASHININLLDELSGNIIWSSKSRAFNWQQGSRLQWINESKFIFSDFDERESKYISRVVNIKDYSETIYNYPVQDAYNDQYFLSLNYQRLRTLRPDYGYFCLDKMKKYELDKLDHDGIWKVDIASHNESLLISLKDICAFKTKSEFEEADHKVNHFQIDPSGRSFVFLHRYFFNGRRYDRLLLADVITGDLNLLSESLLVSHYHWLDANTLVVFLDDIDNGECYSILNIATGQKKFLSELSKYGDGHPSGEGNIMVTDTYPNRAGFQSLFLLEDIDNAHLKLLGSFYHPLKFQGVSRCDLHPRLVWNKRVVYFDSVYSGRRQFYKLEFN
jgi:hypothetical protein